MPRRDRKNHTAKNPTIKTTIPAAHCQSGGPSLSVFALTSLCYIREQSDMPVSSRECRCLVATALAAALSLSQLPAQEEQPTYRMEVELFLLSVQVRANRGLSLPDLTGADFAVQLGPRRPPVLHAVRLDVSDAERRAFPYDRWRWPKDELATVYQLSVHAERTDCRQVPKVRFVAGRKGLNIRGVEWRPMPGCFPQKFDHLNR